MFDLSEEELILFKSLSIPNKIQDYLDTLANNLSKHGDTCRSPRRVLQLKRAHCIEGALLAATALWVHGKRPLILDLKALRPDYDHVVAVFKENGHWGAISKTNHPVLRYRDPIYRTLRELALSYFHEYILVSTGEKTLRSFSRPISLTRFGTKWITSEKHLWEICDALDTAKHYPLLLPGMEKTLRSVSDIERKAGRMREWDRSDPRT